MGDELHLPPAIAQLIEAAIAGLKPEPLGHVNYEGLRYHGLPIMGTIGEVWLLRPDGTLWSCDSESGRELESLPPHLQTTALVAGTERYPWLRELLPARPATGIACAMCRGRGRIGPDPGVFCPSCSALGWQAPPI
jgi:hypothetical protein